MNKAQRFFQSTGGQIITFVVAFTVLRLVWTFAFFSEFLGAYDAIAQRVGVNLHDCCVINPFHSASIFFYSYCNPVFALVMIISLVPLFLHRKYFKDADISFSRTERVFFAVLAFLIGWELATYDFNYYLDNAFYLDRVLLLFLPLLIFFYPRTIILYISFALAYRAQFNYPVDGFPMFDKRLLFDLLMAAMAWYYCRLFIRNYRIPVFYFVVVIVAAGYFASGMKKILISPHGYEWVMNNNPLDLFTNVHQRGWLACTSPSTYQKLEDFIAATGHFWQWLVLITELSALFILRNRKLAIGILISAIVMHAGIFLFGSMLFWKWMAVDLLLVFILWRQRNTVNTLFRDKTLRWGSVVLIALAFAWLQPTPIGWHDTGVNQFFTYEVIDGAGNVYQFDKNQMNPYHQWFQFDHFTWLSQEPVLPVSGFGYVNDYKTAVKLRQTDSASIAELTTIQNYDAKKKQEFEEFIRTYFHNRNKFRGHYLLLPAISPPDHLHTSSCGTDVYHDDSDVVKFRVILNCTICRNSALLRITHRVVDEIEIPQ